MKRMNRDTVLGQGVTLGQLEAVERRALATGNEVYVRIALRAARSEPEALTFISKLVAVGYLEPVKVRA